MGVVLLSYVVVDVRSHEEHYSSGGGVFHPSIRLEPQVLPASQLALGSHSSWCLRLPT